MLVINYWRGIITTCIMIFFIIASLFRGIFVVLCVALYPVLFFTVVRASIYYCNLLRFSLVATPPPSAKTSEREPRKLSVKNFIDSRARLGALGLLSFYFFFFKKKTEKENIYYLYGVFVCCFYIPFLNVQHTIYILFVCFLVCWLLCWWCSYFLGAFLFGVCCFVGVLFDALFFVLSTLFLWCFVFLMLWRCFVFGLLIFGAFFGFCGVLPVLIVCNLRIFGFFAIWYIVPLCLFCHSYFYILQAPWMFCSFALMFLLYIFCCFVIFCVLSTLFCFCPVFFEFWLEFLLEFYIYIVGVYVALWVSGLWYWWNSIYKKVLENLLFCGRLYIIILAVGMFYHTNQGTPHKPRHTPHTTNHRQTFYILHIAQMTKQEKLEILKAPSLWYWSGCSGLEFKRFDYGIEDYAVFVAGARTWHPTAHRAKIRYNAKGEPFLYFHGYTVKFSDTIRA